MGATFRLDMVHVRRRNGNRGDYVGCATRENAAIRWKAWSCHAGGSGCVGAGCAYSGCGDAFPVFPVFGALFRHETRKTGWLAFVMRD